MYYIGIDGGGTKTVAVLSTSKGHILAYQQQTAATNPNRVGLDRCLMRLHDLLTDLKTQHPTAYANVRSIYCGVAGGSSSTYQQAIIASIRPALPEHSFITVHHDAIAALYSATLGQPGIIHISGTGSVTYAIDALGNEHRLGGWGYLLGDEGSGFAIGRSAIRAALTHKERNTPLQKLILQHFSTDVIENVIPAVYQENGRDAVAQLCPFVFQAFEEGDPLAEDIIVDSANGIAIQLVSLINRINNHGDGTIVLAGGVMNQTAIVSMIKCALSKETSSWSILTPTVPPVIGALIAAIKPYEKVTKAVETNALRFLKQETDYK
ncbi:N-acetylglucosamine kinase [Shouchella miscanthi]|uniref:ROK family protein n=1 Tax=Shouchella miscanthi TaxID=2598861 RepID=A0ABU6NKR0_9BACI|nr:ROK family protein [Shouchella miscanthi]